MRIALGLLTLLFSLHLITNALQADYVIYDNLAGGAAGIDNGLLSDSDFPFIQADDFVLAVTNTAVSATWTGAYAFDNTPPTLDNFTINLFLDSGVGLPGALFNTINVGSAVNRVDSGQDIFGFDIYEYRASFLSSSLDAGQTYWLSISNNTVGEADDWYWGVNFNAGNSFSSNNGGTTWVARNHRHDFQLYAVPEPGSLWVLGLGIATIGFTHRRRRTKSSS